MAMEPIDALTPKEMLTLAGLLRKLIRMDGRFSEEERDAIARIATAIGESTDLAQGANAIGEQKLFARIEAASEAFPDDQKLRTAALEITRQEARETMHAVLFDVAASDAIGKQESDLLEWLEEKWELESSEPAGEDPMS